MTFGPITGPDAAAIQFARDTDGAPQARSYTQYAGQRLGVETLRP